MNHFLANGFLPPWFPLKRRSVHVVPQQPSRRSLNQSLEYYDTPGVFPPSARIDPTFKLQPRRPLHLWEYWKYAAYITGKGKASGVSISSLDTEPDLGNSNRTGD